MSVENSLSENNNLYVITARPKEIADTTIRTISQHFPDIFLEVLFSNDFFNGSGSKKKSEVCKQFDVELLIEDNRDYALDCAKNGIKVLLLDKPWNKNYFSHTNIIKVNDWYNINYQINNLVRI